METKPVTFVPHGLTSPEVQARIASLDDTAQATVERINKAVPESMMLDAQKRVNAIIKSHRNLETKLTAFYAVVDEVMKPIASECACRKGCSHCCHITVLITEHEAAYIGKRIGRKPAKPKTVWRNPEYNPVDWGYHNPCTFLVDGACSIYAHRPLPCRTQYNADVDSLLCELTPPESKPVRYVDNRKWDNAWLKIVLSVHHDRAPVVADIREFFPKVKP